MEQHIISSLKGVLEEIVKLIEQNDTDLNWSGYNTEEEILNELHKYIKELSKEKFFKFDDIKMLFVPTSSLQDIAIHSGWGKEFLVISSKVDDLLEQIAKKANVE